MSTIYGLKRDEANFGILDSTDTTKQILFNAGGTTDTATTILAAQTADRTITLPDSDGTVITTGSADFGTTDVTTGGEFIIDVDGTAIAAAGALTMGAGADASIYFDGTNLVLDGPAALDVSVAGTSVGTWDSGGIDIVTGDTYAINGADVLSATTLGSAVVSSSLTTVGALDSGSITSGFGAIDNGTSNMTTGGIVAIDVDGTAINAAGSLTLGAGSDCSMYWDGTNMVLDTASGAGIAMEVSGTQYAILDVNALNLTTGLQYEINSTGVLSSTTLGSGVVNSSLTNVGTLTTLTVDDITVNANTISSAGASALTLTATAGQVLSLEGVTIDGGVVDAVASIDIDASGSLTVDGTAILSDSAGTMTLSNIDALDATTESTIEAAIDTLSNLTTTGALNAGSITSGFGNIDVGSSNIDGGTITADTSLVGTLGTAAQANITSVGTLTSLTTSGDVSVGGMVNLGSPSELTIATGVVTATSSYHRIDTESDAATDDLDTINGGTEGDILYIQSVNNGRVPTVTENGNIRVVGSSRELTSSQSFLLLQYRGSTWFEVSYIGSYA